MPEISAGRWAQMVADYEAATVDARAARRALETASDGLRAPLKAEWEELQRRRHERQDLLLSVEAPSVEAAAYQLRLFAELCRLPDPAGPPPAEDDHAGVLHRIYAGLRKLAAAHAQ